MTTTEFLVFSMAVAVFLYFALKAMEGEKSFNSDYERQPH